ncbi:MAG: L-threonylcarbamoyladenylate synthase [Marinifilaceae bacterium]|jgi:tRNA threonylcarbamoyl adenosine modification protein (Sua5/YciO/YrdC/YwlC family)|nr:L-threonylcarbamoyladenylate synthase [Marinifilaceae bacterium]
MFIRLYPENNNTDEYRVIADQLRKGGLIIYPTDTIYAIGCDLNNHKALQKLAKLKKIDVKKANFSIICSDLSNISQYANLSDFDFKLLKRNLPGPFTFILNCSKKLPKIINNKKKTVGVRIPNNPIPIGIVEELGNPIFTASIKDSDEIVEYITDPELIYEKYQKTVDVIIDGGYGDNNPSTIVDLTSGEIDIIRQGKAYLNE